MEKVTVFEQYPFKEGQKINIKNGPRAGDWLVLGCDGTKVHLKCPVSGREFQWNHFCYIVEEVEQEEWPRRD